MAELLIVLGLGLTAGYVHSVVNVEQNPQNKEKASAFRKQIDARQVHEHLGPSLQGRGAFPDPRAFTSHQMFNERQLGRPKVQFYRNRHHKHILSDIMDVVVEGRHESKLKSQFIYDQTRRRGLHQGRIREKFQLYNGFGTGRRIVYG